MIKNQVKAKYTPRLCPSCNIRGNILYDKKHRQVAFEYPCCGVVLDWRDTLLMKVAGYFTNRSLNRLIKKGYGRDFKCK
jgi:predicted RNA-binding Zn-ribbon protein involved in translation (DUF1610 family)